MSRVMSTTARGVRRDDVLVVKKAKKLMQIRDVADEEGDRDMDVVEKTDARAEAGVLNLGLQHTIEYEEVQDVQGKGKARDLLDKGRSSTPRSGAPRPKSVNVMHSLTSNPFDAMIAQDRAQPRSPATVFKTPHPNALTLTPQSEIMFDTAPVASSSQRPGTGWITTTTPTARLSDRSVPSSSGATMGRDRKRSQTLHQSHVQAKLTAFMTRDQKLDTNGSSGQSKVVSSRSQRDRMYEGPTSLDRQRQSTWSFGLRSGDHGSSPLIARRSKSPPKEALLEPQDRLNDQVELKDERGHDENLAAFPEDLLWDTRRQHGRNSSPIPGTDDENDGGSLGPLLQSFSNISPPTVSKDFSTIAQTDNSRLNSTRSVGHPSGPQDRSMKGAQEHRPSSPSTPRPTLRMERNTKIKRTSSSRDTEEETEQSKRARTWAPFGYEQRISRKGVKSSAVDGLVSSDRNSQDTFETISKRPRRYDSLPSSQRTGPETEVEQEEDPETSPFIRTPMPDIIREAHRRLVPGGVEYGKKAKADTNNKDTRSGRLIKLSSARKLIEVDDDDVAIEGEMDTGDTPSHPVKVEPMEKATRNHQETEDIRPTDLKVTPKKQTKRAYNVELSPGTPSKHRRLLPSIAEPSRSRISSISPSSRVGTPHHRRSRSTSELLTTPSKPLRDEIQTLATWSPYRGGETLHTMGLIRSRHTSTSGGEGEIMLSEGTLPPSRDSERSHAQGSGGGPSSEDDIVSLNRQFLHNSKPTGPLMLFVIFLLQLPSTAPDTLAYRLIESYSDRERPTEADNLAEDQPDNNLAESQRPSKRARFQSNSPFAAVASAWRGLQPDETPMTTKASSIRRHVLERSEQSTLGAFGFFPKFERKKPVRGFDKAFEDEPEVDMDEEEEERQEGDLVSSSQTQALPKFKMGMRTVPPPPMDPRLASAGIRELQRRIEEERVKDRYREQEHGHGQEQERERRQEQSGVVPIVPSSQPSETELSIGDLTFDSLDVPSSDPDWGLSPGLAEWWRTIEAKEG